MSILIYLLLYRLCISTQQNYYNRLYTKCKAFLVVLAPQRGLEPRTNWLTANYSTTELLGNKSSMLSTITGVLIFISRSLRMAVWTY
jgi:hypothetical protein